MSAYHAWTHRPKALGGTDPIESLAVWPIKVFRDDIAVTTGDNKFDWLIPEDLDEHVLFKVEAFVSTAGSGATTVQIHHVENAADMLSTPVTIDSGEKNSKDASVQSVVDITEATVVWGDHIRIDVDAAGSGATGLGVYFYFYATTDMVAQVTGATGAQGPPGTAGAPGATGDTGPQGDPGGITDWEGAWTPATSYQESDAVSHNGSSYVAVQAHTSDTDDDEPGVGANWEDYWMLLAEAGLGEGLAFEITQTAHGFSAGDVLSFDDPDYVLAQADSPFNAEVVGIVSEDIDTNTFMLRSGGLVEGLTGLTAGTVYFLSETTPGLLTATEPSGVGEVSKPLLIAVSTTSGHFWNFRGTVISAQLTAEDIPFTPAGSIAATDVQAAIEEVASEGGGSGAAEDVSVTDTGGFYTGTDVEAVLAEIPGLVAVRLLASTTVSSPTGTIDFTSIPGTYSHLQVVLMGRSDRAAQTFEFVGMRFNNDSSSIYDYQQLLSQDTAASATETFDASSGYVGDVTAASATADQAGIIVIDIPYYSSTVFDKNAIARSYTPKVGTQMAVQELGIHWDSTAAITRVTFIALSSTNFIAGTQARLYGIL